jgi:hypothetical protein
MSTTRSRVTNAVGVALLVVFAGALLALRKSRAPDERRCAELLDKADDAIRHGVPEQAKYLLHNADGECGASGQERRATLLARADAPPTAPPSPWATIPTPGYDLPATITTRLTYAAAVLVAAPGEPSIDRSAAVALSVRLHAKLAELADVPIGAIKGEVTDAAVRFVVDAGTTTKLPIHGSEYVVPVCSEVYLFTSMAQANVGRDDLLAAGVRGLQCVSNGCVAVLDIRPTAKGPGLYGDGCVSFGELRKIRDGSR